MGRLASSFGSLIARFGVLGIVGWHFYDDGDLLESVCDPRFKLDRGTRCMLAAGWLGIAETVLAVIWAYPRVESSDYVTWLLLVVLGVSGVYALISAMVAMVVVMLTTAVIGSAPLLIIALPFLALRWTYKNAGMTEPKWISAIVARLYSAWELVMRPVAMIAATEVGPVKMSDTLHHLTLNTGHVVRSGRDEVRRDVIDALLPIIEAGEGPVEESLRKPQEAKQTQRKGHRRT